MRYLPIVMGVCFVVVVKIIKKYTDVEHLARGAQKAKTGMPSCRGAYLIQP